MAVYQSLTLPQGDVAPLIKQVKATREPHLFIGLGGSGIDCLRAVKAAVYERLIPDNPEDATPEYSRIKFLAVDADDYELRHDNEDPSLAEITDREYFSIRLHPAAAIKPEEKPYLQWLNPNLNLHPTAAGAGGIRQLGRLMLMEHSMALMGRLRDLMMQLKQGLERPYLTVHIFTGLTGGVGSGIFLDVCYLVQRVMLMMGRGGDNKIFGYCLMPDVNLLKAPNEASRAYMRVNGYAALKELDYCMNLEQNGGQFTQQYPCGQNIVWDREPVDLCHLVSATDQNGMMLKDGYAHAVSTVCDHAMRFLTEHSGSPAHHAATLHMLSGRVPKYQGVNNRYVLLGSARITFPYREMCTYQATGLFERIEAYAGSAAQKQENLRDAITERKLFDYALMMKALGQKRAVFTPSGFSAQEVRESGTYMVEKHFEKQFESAFAEIKEQANAMADREGYNSISYMVEQTMDGGLFKGAWDAKTVAAFFSDEASDGIFCPVEELQRKVSAYLTQSKAAWNQLYEQYAKAEREMRGANWFNANHRFAVYEAALMQLQQNKLEYASIEEMNGLLPAVKANLKRLRDEKYLPLARAWDRLKESFAQNKAYLTLYQPKGLEYVSLEPLKPSLDQAIANADAAAVYQELCQALLADKAALVFEKEPKICQTVTDLFANVFGDVESKTLTEYLEMGYGMIGKTALAQALYQEKLLPFYEKAKPLFYPHPLYLNSSSLGCRVTLKMSEQAMLLAVDERLRDLDPSLEVQLANPCYGNECTLLSCVWGLPLFAFADAEQWEQRYLASRAAGVHLYENGGVDWHDLPSIIPQSLRGADAPDAIKAGRALYDKAKQLGVFQKAGPSDPFDVCLLSEADKEALNELLAKGESCIDIGDTFDAHAVLDQIKASLDALKLTPSRYYLNNDAVYGSNTDAVLLDYLWFAPVIYKAVKKTVDLVLQARAMCDSLSAFIELQEKQGKFYELLFAGMLDISEYQVSCEVITYGIENTLMLSTPEMEYGVLPLYQAYQSFLQLDEESIAYLEQELIRRKDDINGMKAALAAVGGLFGLPAAERYESRAMLFSDHREAIELFYEQMKAAYQAAAFLYGVESAADTSFDPAPQKQEPQFDEEALYNSIRISSDTVSD